MVDNNNGNIEEVDIDYINQSIQNNGLNISKSVDELTKELRMHNILKVIELDLDKSYSINYQGLSEQAKKVIKDYLED